MGLRLRRLARPGANWRIWAAIVFGVAVWVGVTLEQNPRVTNFTVDNVPVDLRGLDSGLVSTLDPLPVDILLQGLRDDLDEITTRNFRASLPLAGIGPGNHLIAVDLAISAADSIEVVNVIPGALPVTLVSVISEQRAIEIDYDVELAAGFELELEQVRVEPPVATLSGPETAVNLVDRVEVTVVTEGLNRTQGLQVQARALGANGAEVEDVITSPNLVVIVLPVSEIAVRKTVPITVETAGSPAPGFAISETRSAPFAVQVQGTADAVAAVDSVRTEPVVLRGQRTERTYQGRLVVPAGVELVEPEQDYEITIDVTAIESAVALADVIEFDAPSNFIATVSPAVATVVMQGSSQRVLGIVPRDVTTWVELDGPAVEGVHILVPRVRAPAGVEVVSVEPIVVTLNLSPRPEPSQPEPEPEPEPEAEPEAEPEPEPEATEG